MLESTVDDPERPGAGRRATAAHLLAVYAMPDCPGWGRAQELAAIVREMGIARLEVCFVDLTRADKVAPECVVASPTWVLDDRRIAFGNPEPDWLLSRLGALMGGD
jgi:hypothetical protein